MTALAQDAALPASTAVTELDAVVIGAGFSGMYMLKSLRDKLGMKVKIIEAGHGVGGTWYWDPNDLLCMAWKWQRGDVSRLTDGNLQQALGRITAKTFVMPIDEDMFFPPRDCEAEQKMIAGSEFRPIKSIDGHLALFGADPACTAQIDQHLRELLETRV